METKSPGAETYLLGNAMASEHDSTAVGRAPIDASTYPVGTLGTLR